MKNVHLFALAIMLLILTCNSCKPKLSHNDECGRYLTEAGRFMELYQESGGQLFLDSAMIYINKIDCEKYIAATKFYKSRIYYNEGRFLEAIKSIESIPDTLMDFHLLKCILIWDIESKWAIADGNRDREIAIYKRQDAILQDTIQKKWLIYDSTLKTLNNIVRIDNSEAVVVVSQYFYNKAKFMDKDIVLSEIDLMYNIVKGGDAFFEELKYAISEDPEYILDNNTQILTR